MTRLSRTRIERTNTEKNEHGEKRTNPAEESRVWGEPIEKRVRGIEPPLKAWEAFVLPLNHTRETAVKLPATCSVVKQRELLSAGGSCPNLNVQVRLN